MSATAKLINEVVSSELSARVKAAGFKRKGRNFHRVLSDSVHVVNVQASQWNSGANGSFTLNLGVWFPAVYRLAGGRPLKNLPREVDCTVRQRIGFLTPGRLDTWWDVSCETNLQKLGKECADIFTNHGLPWMDGLGDLNSLYEEVFVRQAGSTSAPFVGVFAQVVILFLTHRTAEMREFAKTYIARANQEPAEKMQALVKSLDVEL